MSTITLYTEKHHEGTEYSFDPSGNVYVYNEENVMSKSAELPLSYGKNFRLNSIKNDTDYIVLVFGVNVFDVLIGSIEDTDIFQDGDVQLIRAIKMPKPTCDDTNKNDNTNAYKITMIVFIILFSFMVIGLLILYFTGRLKF